MRARSTRIKTVPQRKSNPKSIPAFYREAQLVPSMLPVSSSTLWRMVRRGEFPAPVKLAPKVTAWPAGPVDRWIREREESSK